MRERTYVVATDFSTSSRMALEAAVSLARRSDARVDLICAVPPSVAKKDRRFVRRAEETLERLAKRAGADEARRHVVVAPDAAEAVALHARTVAADLVAVGPRSKPAWKRVLLGSVTERLLRLAPTMLLIVRPGFTVAPVRILAAVDRPSNASRELRIATDVARLLDAKLFALHAVPPPGAALIGAPGLYQPEAWALESARVEEERITFTDWVRRFPHEGVDVEPRVVEGHAVEAILREAKSVRAPLIVVGSHAKTAVHEFFVGSVAHGVASHAPVSVLVVRARPSGGLVAARRARRRSHSRI